MAKILIIDDDEPIRQVLSTVLASHGYNASASGDGNEALARIGSEEFDAVLCDLRMTPIDGIEVVRRALASKPKLRIIMLTAYASVKTAREAMKLGAFNYLTKPWNLDELLVNVQRAVSGESVAAPEPVKTVQSIPSPAPWGGQPWKAAAEAATSSDAPTLIRITGMDAVSFARSIHDGGRRRSEPFVALPCATLPEPVLEVQLHGCVRGAVEEIQAGCPGVFESAGAGTVVLDEISWMPHKLQERFVNILSIGSIRRLGGLEDIPVGARILATTAQDPNDLLAQHAIIPTLHGYFASHILRVEV